MDVDLCDWWRLRETNGDILTRFALNVCSLCVCLCCCMECGNCGYFGISEISFKINLSANVWLQASCRGCHRIAMRLCWRPIYV